MAITDDIYETIFIAMIDYLRTNITDPLSARTDWITGAYPPFTYTKPQICLNKLGKPFRKGVEHGDIGEIGTYRIQVSIFCGNETVVTINSTEYAGPALVQKLASMFDRALKTSKNWFWSNHADWFQDITVTASSDKPYRESPEEFRSDIDTLVQVFETWR
jgi:hypothetical protein